MRPKISFIGAGKVGNTLARLYHHNGYIIEAIYNRTRHRAETLAKRVGATVTDSPEDAVTHADLICLTVADDAIATTVSTLQAAGWSQKAIVHTSGSQTVESLKPLADKGAMVGSLHPAYPIASSELPHEVLHGASFAIEASHNKLQQWLLDLVAAANGNPVIIPAGQKAIYHAALVIASNYTVTLYATAHQLMKSLNADDVTIDKTLLPLLNATVNNIQRQGIPEALTGPLSRADTGTLQSHLDALHSMDADLIKQTYINLARLSYPMLTERNIDIQSIEQELREHK